MRCRRLLSVLLPAALLSVSTATARAQYVEVPAFSVGGPPQDFGILTSGVAPGPHGDFLAVWHEMDHSDHVAPVPQAVVNQHVTPPSSFGDYERWERMVNTIVKPGIVAVPGGYFDFWGRLDRDTDMWALRLDASGAPLGKEFRVSDLHDFAWLGRESAATAYGSGVVFFWYEEPPAVSHVVARLFDLAGTPRGPAFEVGFSGPDPFMDAVELADGGFVLGWGGSPYATINALGRSYLPSGQPRDDMFQFSPQTLLRRLAVSRDGAMIAMTGVRSSTGSTSANEVWAGRFATDGTPLAPEFLVHAAPPGVFVMPDVAFDFAGNLYVTWTESANGTHARGFDTADVPLGPAVQLGTEPALEVHTERLSDGRFVNLLNRLDAAVVRASIVSLCTPGTSVCGDGILRSECEQCDDGAANSDTTADACRTTCRVASCGDGTVDSGEECDDGNTDDCDGCDAFCRVELGLGCGDGVPNAACGEPCDDGNAVAGDGCSPTCALERVPGGGTASTDCYTEWVVDNPTNTPLLDDGAFRHIQLCTDGDPGCDFDPTPGACSFRLRVCANNTDVPGCEAGSRLASWTLRQPSASQAASRPTVAAARAALLGAVPATIVGPGARDVCSAFVDVPVPTRGNHAGKLSLKTIATLYDRSHDTDTLKLVCVPALP